MGKTPHEANGPDQATISWGLLLRRSNFHVFSLGANAAGFMVFPSCTGDVIFNVVKQNTATCTTGHTITGETWNNCGSDVQPS